MPASYTIPGGLLQTFDVGFFPSDTAVHHEDLTDICTIIDSTQAPFFSGAPKIRARDVVHSWTVDALAAPSYAGAPDGGDFQGDTLTTPTRMMNSVQTFRKDVSVSDREREANPAGIRDMYDHQVMKAFKENVRNFEYAVFRGQSTASATSIGGVGTTAAAPYMAGFRGFTTLLTAAPATSAVGFTLGVMWQAAMNMFAKGAEPDSIWMSPQTKQAFFEAVSAGGAINYRGIAASDMRLIANVDVIESPMGQLFAVITDRFIPMTSASATSATGCYFMGDRSMAKVAFYRPPQHKQMGKTGDNTKGIVLMDATLQLTHPSAWCAVTAISGVSGYVWDLA